MLDKERILSKIDELNVYLAELKEIIPSDFKEYQKIEKKRSCERLLQLEIECVIDICKMFVSGLKLGLPVEENDIFDKMLKKKILSEKAVLVLKKMRGFRNILIHEYAVVNDKLVYEKAKGCLKDFEKIKKEILAYLRKS